MSCSKSELGLQGQPLRLDPPLVAIGHLELGARTLELHLILLARLLELAEDVVGSFSCSSSKTRCCFSNVVSVPLSCVSTSCFDSDSFSFFSAISSKKVCDRREGTPQEAERSG